MIQKIGALWVQLLGYLKPIDGVPPLLARLYLTPVMLQAGYTKLVGFDNTVSWFESMGMPLPVVSDALVALSEYIGGILLYIG
ncbi:MAG: DoxX family protein, partial [Gammaproteobacteria bacterium]|nr:DoxX family protein [Gammaproteobacteria bacterium]